MAHNFKSIKPGELTDNLFTLINDDWMLITSGTPESYNMMTANWGGAGILWRKKVCFVFVRPSRYTYEFMEKNETFSLSFFTKEWRKALDLCGSKSGRDINKAKETGLVPFAGDYKSTGFEQARMVIECKKLYFQDLNPKNFLDPAIEGNYNGRDYHRMYVGEILDIKIKY